MAELLCAFRDWFDYTSPSDESMLASVERLMRDPASTEFLLGAADATAPAAAVCQLRFRHSVWTGSDDAWLEDIYVRDAERGTGLGRALAQLAIDRARDRGCGRIQLDVHFGNESALALYRSLGFGETGDPPGGETLMLGKKLQVVRDAAHHEPHVQS